jgi:hypothetical protein
MKYAWSRRLTDSIEARLKMIIWSVLLDMAVVG